MVRVAYVVMFALVAGVLAGCGSGRAEGRLTKRGETISVLRAQGDALRYRVRILELDGQLILAERLEGVEIFPGRHRVRVRIEGWQNVKPAEKELDDFPDPSQAREVTLSFQAEGGRTYTVRGVLGEDRAWAWVRDERTREVVAGERPPG